jgi:hypothetical protein
MDKENLSSERQNMVAIPGLAIAMDPKANSCWNSTQPNFKTGSFKSGSGTTVFDSDKCREPQPNIINAPANVNSPTKNIVQAIGTVTRNLGQKFQRNSDVFNFSSSQTANIFGQGDPKRQEFSLVKVDLNLSKKPLGESIDTYDL